MLKKFLIFFCVIAFCTEIIAQDLRQVGGRVLDVRNGQGVPFAYILVAETDQIAISDENGWFLLKAADITFYTLEVRRLGYETYSGKVPVLSESETPITVTLNPLSYAMGEVKVLPRNIRAGDAGSSLIGNAAIEYIQPSSLSEVMQLLPGNLSVNPEFNSPQKVSVRQISPTNNSALGTAIWVDGAPLMNDANMQTLSTARFEDGFATTVGSGIDLRQIPTDQIESIEVIRGIPSVVYGDLTSGLVLIKTKSGLTPWELKLKTDPGIKQISMGKGLNVNHSGGSVNFNLDYLHTYDDIRIKGSGFERLTGETGYSGLYNRAGNSFSLNAKVAFYNSIDHGRFDPDAMVVGESFRSQDAGFRVNLNGKWSANYKMLTSLDYSFALTSAHQKSIERQYVSLSGIPSVSTSLEPGINTGIFLPSERFVKVLVDGRPLTFFGKLTAQKNINFGSGSFNKFLYGMDFRLNANRGNGGVYDLQNGPLTQVYNWRPRKFSDIPAIRSYSVYVEENLSLKLRETTLDVKAGIRLNNFQSEGLFKSKVGFFTEPRFNAQYSFLSKANNNIFDNLAVSFGMGRAYKAPTMLYLYPDKAWFDLSLLSYYVGNPEYNLTLFDSRVFDTSEPDLRPVESSKLETGIVFKINKTEGFITFFREKVTNEFDFTKQYLFLNFDRYDVKSVPANSKPDPAKLPSSQSATTVSYRKPANDQQTSKTGLEFGVDFGRIKPIYTSLSLDGAWLRIRELFDAKPYQDQPRMENANQFLYYGVYAAGNYKVSERLNTNLRMVTQIPQLSMIFSTMFQVVWFESYYFRNFDRTPLYMVYADGSTQNFTAEMETDPVYSRYLNSKTPEYFLKEKMGPLLQVNFRLSKEIYDWLKFSFYVNNAVNYRPFYEYKRSGSFTRRNPSVYFGAELKLVF